MADISSRQTVSNGLSILRKKPRGPNKLPTKTQVTLRLDQDVLAAFKATGKGWQSRINDVLRRELP